MRNQDDNILSNIDWKVVAIYIALVVFGWMNIYSAVYDEAAAGVFDLERQHGKQLLWIAIAFVTAIFTLIIDSRFFFFCGLYHICAGIVSTCGSAVYGHRYQRSHFVDIHRVV